jgi:two-component system, OmpR family, sensor histidine kinase KdpD
VFEHRGVAFEEMDVDQVIRRRPVVALVDELAHTNVPGSRNAKRWEDVEELLVAGIDVVTTVNIQHLESMNDVVARITGITQRETVPDAFVRQADQVELVDMSPEALRRRMAHGNVYPAEKIDAALGNYFRPGNLAALRELALLWVADRVEDALQEYMDAHDIDHPWETRERVVVAVTGAPGGDQLVRRAARIAGRLRGELLGVSVVRPDGLASRQGPVLDVQRTLLHELGGSYHEVVGSDVAEALVAFAHAERATQLVLGASRRSRLDRALHGHVVTKVIGEAGEMDVHVISNAAEPSGEERRERARRTLVRSRSPLGRRRTMAGAAVVAVGLPLLTVVLGLAREHLSLTAEMLAYLTLVVVAAAVGGTVVGLVAAVSAFLLLNWFFTPPLYTWTVASVDNAVALVAFVAVGAFVSALVSVAARRATEANRAGAEAEALARTTAIVVGERDPLPLLVQHVRAGFAQLAVAVLVRDGQDWRVVASTGEPVPTSPAAGEALALGDDGMLVMVGPPLTGPDRRLLQAFAAQLATALDRRRLAEEAAEARRLAAAEELRTALLRAVSHDLRTPLAGIKASVSSLLADDVTFDAATQREFLESIDAGADRLDRVVGNLLDMGRIQAGALQVVRRPTNLDDVVGAALRALPGGDAVVAAVAPELPAVQADGALLEQAVANLLANALAASAGSGQPVRVEAGMVGSAVDLRVVDRGPGIPPELRERVFEPFQRLHDRGGSQGVGLGLAIARGFVRAMGGELSLDDTPGGGLTATIRLERAP